MIQLQRRLGNVFSLSPQKQENKIKFANEWGFREAHQRAKYVSPRTEGMKEAGASLGQKNTKTDTTKDQSPQDGNTKREVSCKVTVSPQYGKNA